MQTSSRTIRKRRTNCVVAHTHIHIHTHLPVVGLGQAKVFELHRRLLGECHRRRRAQVATRLDKLSFDEERQRDTVRQCLREMCENV